MTEESLSESGRRALARVLLVVGSILFGVSVPIWLASQFVATNLALPAQVVFAASIVILHIPLLTLPGDSGKFYVVYTNLLNGIGAASLALSLNTWVFLVPGLIMAFLGYFFFKIPYARGTQYLWGNLLVLIGAGLVVTGNTLLGSAVQAGGLILSGLTVALAFRSYPTTSAFDAGAFVALSVTGWVLMLGILFWVFVRSDYYIGFSWLIEGIIVGFAVSKIHGGFWPVWIPRADSGTGEIEVG